MSKDYIEIDGYANRTAAEKKLASEGTSLIVNSEACATNFPKTWTTNSLKKHLEIARLVNMFTALYDDYCNCKSHSSKQLIEQEMKRIQYTLIFKYYVVTDDELVPDYETRRRYEERNKK